MYALVVGNIGQVYDGDDLSEAERLYVHYCELSVTSGNRASGEDVTLFEGEWPIREYFGNNGEPHYIAMAGLHGCIPNFCDSYESVSDAVESLAQIHDLGRRRKAELKRNLYLELNLQRDGNAYCEIQECNCGHPEDHSDG